MVANEEGKECKQSWPLLKEGTKERGKLIEKEKSFTLTTRRVLPNKYETPGWLLPASILAAGHVRVPLCVCVCACVVGYV